MDTRLIWLALGTFAVGVEGFVIATLLPAIAADGLYAATAQAAAVTLSTPERRGRAIATVVAGTTMAVALGAPIGAFLSGFAGWRGTYFAIAAVGVLTSIAIYAMLPHGIKGDRRGLGERLGVLRVPGLLPALLTILLYMAGPFAAFIYLGPVTTKLMGLDAALLPFVMLAYGLGAAMGNPLGGQLSDRIGAQATVTIAAVLNIVFLVLLGAIPMLPAAAVTPVYFGFMVLWGIAGWMFVPGQVSRVVALSPSSAPLALSLNASFLYLGTALGALVGGYVLEHLPIDQLGLVAAVFPALALGVIFLSRPRPVFMPRLG